MLTGKLTPGNGLIPYAKWSNHLVLMMAVVSFFITFIRKKMNFSCDMSPLNYGQELRLNTEEEERAYEKHY